MLIKPASSIADNEAGRNGGAIWINSAADCDCNDNLGVTMSGGDLLGNQAQNGGAIYVDTGKTGVSMNFAMSGGTVAQNKSTKDGGAVYISGGNVTVSGGTITENTAQT